MKLHTALYSIFTLINLSLPFSLLAQTNNNDIASFGGNLIVVNKSDNTVSIIDLAQQKIVNTLPTGKGPHELVATGNGKWAVSSNFVGGNSLTVFDLVKQRVANTIDLYPYLGPHGIKFLKDNKRLAVTSGRSQHLLLVNIFSNEIEAAINTQQKTTHMVAISQKENFAYTTNIASNSISKILLAEKRLVEQFPTQASPEAINITQNGKQIWYGANKLGLVTVIDTSTQSQLAQFDGFSFPYRVLFSGDESVAMVPDFRLNTLRFFNTQTFKELGELDLGEDAGPQGIVLHPHLNVAFLSLNSQNKILAIDVHTRKIIGQYPTGNNPDGIAFFKNK